MKAFYQVLANTLVANVVNMTVWFALTFFVYLQTRSVFATGLVAGIYLITVAASGFWFGSVVDHYKKQVAMQFSGVASLAFYLLSTALYVVAPEGTFKDVASPWLWSFVSLLLFGVIAGNIRTIAMPTLVTILIPEDRRDKANGLVGAATGASFLVVSVISGLMIGFWGMMSVLILALVATVAVILHLGTVTVPEPEVVHTSEGHQKIDIKGTLKVVSAVPGLLALILFSTFNNFLGGVYMALMDAYGLSLVSVQVWGILWGVISVAFIVGGLIVAKKGLGKNPLKTMFIAIIIMWVISSIFTLKSSIVLLTIGMFIYLLLVPFIEAGEQTIMQKVVPLERQGRVFGFAQSMEQAASPLTAFLAGPLTQFIVIPFMSKGGQGAELIGSWFGTGPARGMALVFTITGIIGLIITLLAMTTSSYRRLTNRYLHGAKTEKQTNPA